MRRRWMWVLAGLLILAGPGALAQQIIQSGKPIPGHAGRWITNLTMGDAGPANGGPAGTGLTELNITSTLNNGLPFCVNDAPTNGPFHQLCLGADAQGGGLVSYNAFGGASPLPLQCNVNGQLTTCLSGGGAAGNFPVPACTPDGTTDNSSCVQAAITNLCATGGGTLLIPTGRWKFHDIAISCDGVHITGAGQGGPAGWSGTTNAGNNATYVDCSAMVSYCIHFTPTGFPAGSRLSGGSVEKIAFTNTAGAGTVLGFDQVTGGYVRDVSTWNAPNAVRIFGAFYFNAFSVQTWGTAGTSWDISGSMAGKTAAGAACTLGDCSTRADFVVLTNLYGTQAPTGVFVSIHDQAFTVVGTHLGMENGAAGLRVRCAAGQPNLAYCPQQIIFEDFEVEYAVAPYDLQDFTQFRCTQCYGAGITGTVPFSGPSYTTNVVRASLVNYPIVTGSGGGVSVNNGQFFGSSGSCVWVGVDNTNFTNNEINGCNGASTTGGGIEFNSGSQHRSTGNGFCSGTNAAPYVMVGIVANANAQQVSSTGDSFFNCQHNVTNNSTTPYNVYISNPNPPPRLTSVSNTTGLGTGGTASPNGNALGGTILLQPGTGAAASGQIQLNFAEPQYPQSSCTVNQVAGASTWAAGANIQGMTSTSSTFVFTWVNSSTALSSGGGYYLFYKCSGF